MKHRIAFISDHASPLATLGSVDSGGQNVYVAELARQLSAQGYLIDIYTRRDHEQQKEVVEWLPGVRVIHISAGPATYVPKEQLLPYMPVFAEEMETFIRRNQLGYKLMHAHFFMSGCVASVIRRQLNIPYVITFHALGLVRRIHQKEADQFPVERVSIETMLVHDADHIIAECPQDKEDLVEHYEACEQNISIIPCGFSPREFYPINKTTARRQLQLPVNGKIVLQLGRMVPRKGVDNVIRGLGNMKKHGDPVYLVIVGGEADMPEVLNTPELKRLQQVAAGAGVLDQVIFTGRQSRQVLRYYYSAADVFVTTPWYEPFGITPLEAMACGTPVIGANVGGIKYSVADGRTGYLVPPHSPEILAKKLDQLLSSPTLHTTMTRNALARVRREFTWEKVARSMHTIYMQVYRKPAEERINNWHDSLLLKDIGQFLKESFFVPGVIRPVPGGS
ncbi:glycosyltransferase family 4 protein [Filimonas effusa]|uniref:Glycosyltransferase family 1 protein n=1 Tax=Filimonas effusa TaxID=2508721 RepID=A0A4Q1D5D0_9BACT|nr:glycosyltransferase family 1 protein [Filimonas effusa]RXK83742.1 glycosyltransferase family 1 protein [Filimonas effusa]